MRKLRNKHRYINKVKTFSNLPELVIQVAVEAMHKQHEALLDSGADANILPLSIFQTLKNKDKVESNEWDPKKSQVHKPTAKVHQRWVPKTSLQAQGFYNGKTSIWLPKKGQK